MDTRKVYCDNLGCSHKTFSERFDFVVPNGKKTKCLVENILVTSVKLSLESASSLLKADYVKTSKSTICDLIKKMPSLADESVVTKVCVDDFAFQKDILMA